MTATLASVAVLTLAAALLGFALDQQWLLPLLEMLPAWVFMVAMLRRGRRTMAIGVMVWWALCLALATVTLTQFWHQRAEAVIFNGAAYRDEMQSWLLSGVGQESTPSQFIPQHLRHTVLFCLVGLISAGFLSVLMGAVLMNYMSFYVGDLILRCQGSPSHALALTLAWNPWSIVRVVSFIILGVVLAEPLLCRFSGHWPTAGRGRWLLAAAGGLLLDILLKTLLAPHWPGLLGGCLG
ncbi:MAG TPA: hypothetical protein VFE84_03320 [Patescibacteria group bacterium]|nr:hypothetical protein [Patescibacteria group bacterium]